MSRRCACGCGRRCTVSEDWAADGCQQRWLEQQIQPLPAVSRVTGAAIAKTDCTGAIRARIVTGLRSWLS